MTDKKTCQCKCCQLEDKITDLLDGQEFSDALPSIVHALARIIVQEAKGDHERLAAHLAVVRDKLCEFCAALVVAQQSNKAPEKPFAWLKAIAAFKEQFDLSKLPTEVRELIEQAKKAGAEVHVVASKVKH